jgi:hypothetical protein
VNAASQSVEWFPVLVLGFTLVVMLALLRRNMKGMVQQDWILLRQVRARGVDLRVAQPVHFMVFAATEETGLQLAGEMRAHGYDTSMKQAQMQYARSKAKPGKPQEGWLITGKRTVVLEPQVLIDARKQLTAMSTEKRALYLGWQMAASNPDPGTRLT